MEKVLRFGIFMMILASFWACDDDDFGEKNDNDETFVHKAGLFIINEGNFGAGNGSVSFFDPESGEVENGIFYAANSRPPGDIPLDIVLSDETAYITVNNSGKVEVVDLEDFESEYTITGFSSPRRAEMVNDVIYISDLESSKLSWFNMEDLSDVKHMDAGKSTEAMLYDGNYLFVTNWSEFYVQQPNNTVMVIDPADNTLVKSIPVAKEPNSLAKDKDGNIWVLSSGGYMNDEEPALSRIDPLSLTVTKTILFDINSSPSHLAINKTGDTLYYVKNGIYKVATNADSLMTNPVIAAAGRTINSLAIDPATDEIYFSNAMDYQQKGWIYRCSPKAEVTDSFRVGIVPGSLKFYRP